KKTTLHDPAHLACRQVENPDPGLIHRRAEGREDNEPLARQCFGPPVAELSDLPVRSRQALKISALSRHSKEPVRVHLREDDRAVLEPRGSADALLIREPER